jgi:hypothetical protein
MHKRYSHLWTNTYEGFGVSLRPEQIEVDLLGFAYEKTSQKRPIFNSPMMEPIQANSSYSFIKPFKANTIMIGEVTTSIIDFDNQDLVYLEQVCLFFLSLLLFSCGYCSLLQNHSNLSYQLMYFVEN